jgi:hypothetical protein
VSHVASIPLVMFLSYTLTNAIIEPIPYDVGFCVGIVTVTVTVTVTVRSQ